MSNLQESSGSPLSKTFSRRDVLKTGAVGLLGGLVACSPLSGVVEGIESDTATAIPHPTKTERPTSTVTETPTSVPTQTPTATETPIPTFEFYSGFEKGYVGFDKAPPGTLSVELDLIPDPTGIRGGKVLKATINQPHYTDELGEMLWRGYPTKTLPPETTAPFILKQVVWISRGLYDALEKDGNWYSVCSLFDSRPGKAYGGRYNNFAGIAMDSYHRYEKRMGLNIHGQGGVQPIEPGAPRFDPETWYEFTLEVTPDGKIAAYQDGILISRGILPDGTRMLNGKPQIVFEHSGGVYAGQYKKNSMPIDGSVFTLSDDQRVYSWS